MKIKLYVLHIFILSFCFCNLSLFAQQQDSLSYEIITESFRAKKYDLALKQALALKNQYDGVKKDTTFYRTMRLIGHCHKKSGNYTRTLACYIKANKGFHKLKDTSYIISNGNNLARMYYYLKKNDSAIYYSKESLHYNSKVIDTTSALTSYGNLVGLYVKNKKFDLAIENAAKAVALSEKYSKSKDNVNFYNNLAGVYYSQENFEKAKEIYLKGFNSFGINTTMNNKNSLIQNLTSVYLLLGENKKAKEFVSKSLAINDSLNAQKYNSKITEIEAKYNVEKEIQVTNLERQKKQQLQLWLLAISLLLMGIISIIWFYYRDNKIKKERLALRLVNQELEQFQKIKKLQWQNQNKVLNAVAVGKETERTAIAQVLHDSVGALLSSANMHLQVVKKKSNLEIEEIQKSQDIIEEASAKVRNLSHQLISEVLLKFGLVVAIESLCNKYSNTDLVFELVEETEVPRFAQPFEIKMHGMIEELLNNAMKHSKATEVVVSLKYQEEMLTAIVEDNGVGLNVKKVNEFERVGLAQIKARVESANGVFIITAVKNKYARFYIKTPVEV